MAGLPKDAPADAAMGRKHRLTVTARVVAGTLGAYVLTAQITVLLSFLLMRAGMDKVEAVTAATLGSFAIFAILCMAVFHAHSVKRAWLWLVGASVPMALLIWGLGPA